MNKIFLTLLSFVLICLLIGCGSDQSEADSKVQAKTETQSQTQTQPQANQTEIQMQTISFDAPDPQGNVHSSSEWIGKGPVVVNFWGTWCPPCRREIPDLVKLYDEYKDKGVEILGLSLRDSPQQVLDFSAQNNMSWVLLVADPAIAVKFNIRSVPMTIFFDKDGNIVEQYKGLRSYEDLKKGFELIS